MSSKNFILVLLVVFIWSANNIIIKCGINDLPPLFLTCMRFIVVSIILIPFNRITVQQLKFILPLSFTFGFMHFSLLFAGMRHTDSGTGSIIVQLGTPLSILLSKFILKEKVNFIQIYGVIISVLGIIVIAGSPTLPNWHSFILLLFSALGWAISNIIIKKSPTIIPSLTITSWMSFFAIPIVGLASFICEKNQIYSLMHSSWHGWFAIFYSAICSSIIAYSLWYILLNKYKIHLLMPYSLLTPVLASTMGIVLLKDSFHLLKISGSILVLLGTAISVINLKSFKFFNKKINH